MNSTSKRVAAAEAPAYGPSGSGVDGHFDGTTITVFVALAGDLSGADIDRVIGGAPIKLNATHTSVTGEYAGPRGLVSLLPVWDVTPSQRVVMGGYVAMIPGFMGAGPSN